MSRSVSLFLVDDHIIVRNALKELIEAMGHYSVNDQFNNGKELVDQIPFKKAPDLIIMDLNMPVKNGMETMHWLQENGITYPVLILSMDTNNSTIATLYGLGMRGYLPKNCTAQMLHQAIDDIINTGHHYNQLLVEALQEEKNPSPDPRQQLLNTLNERELEFLKLVCSNEEYTYKQIADIMNVHRRTIDGYREKLFEKCNVVSKSGLVQFAVKNNLV